MNTRTKLIGTTVLVAALLAPVAQAQRPDDQAGLRGPGGIAALRDAASTHPDNRSSARGPGAYRSADLSAASHPDSRSAARGPGAITPTIVAAPTSGGFDWRDAVIGGLGGFGMALLLTGSLFLVTSQRHKTRMA